MTAAQLATVEQQDFELTDEHWEKLEKSQLYRLNTLYKIKDDDGNIIPFRMRWQQELVYREMHYLNIILKVRQIGFTTLIDLMQLDTCMWNPGTEAGIIAHHQSDVKKIFDEKVLLPYRMLPPEIKTAIPLYPGRRESRQEIRFANESSLSVGMSMRSRTLQMLHVSEYGIVCARFPHKAEEIKTGAFNTAHVGKSVIFIESTAKGAGGDFKELVDQAKKIRDSMKRLGKLDWKLFFFPWWNHDEYELEPEDVVITADDEEYFERLEDKIGIKLTDRKKAWYVAKRRTQGDKMWSEYPSTEEEAFQVAVEGSYYGHLMQKARQSGRIRQVYPDPALVVNTFWDLGIGDMMAIWIAQFSFNEVRCIGYYENHSEGMIHYINWLRDWKAKWTERGVPLAWGEHWAPHDIKVRDIMRGERRIQTAQKMGIEFKIMPDLSLEDGIEQVRQTIPITWFDEAGCDKGITALSMYRKEWDEKLETFHQRPLHDKYSNGADAFRTLSVARAAGAGQTVGGRGMTPEQIQQLEAQFRPPM